MMKNRAVVLFSTMLISLLIGSCATRPTIRSDAILTPFIDSDRAFESVIKAGEDVGFKPLKMPKPDKEKGFVMMVSKSATGRDIAKSLTGPFMALFKDYILEIHIKKEGAIATGVEVVGGHTGVREFEEENVKKLIELYLESLKKHWKVEK